MTWHAVAGGDPEVRAGGSVVQELLARGWDLHGLVVARTFWKRLWGIIPDQSRALARGRHARRAGRHAAIIFPHCSSVHTFFMRRSIDVAFFDADGSMTAYHPGVRPWHVLRHKRACFVAERLSWDFEK